MKKITYLFLVTLFIAACGVKSEKENAETEETKTAAVYTVDSLLTVAEANVDKDITVVGLVKHTCKHSGKRCFIVGEDGKTSIRIEAKGEIGSFNAELVGNEIEVKGILRERRLTSEEIAESENAVKESLEKKKTTAEHCESELNNIAEMRQWMKDRNKDYYSIYYVDGNSYTEVK